MLDMCKSAHRHIKRIVQTELNCQSLEIVEKFCSLGDTTGAREGAVDTVTRIWSGWSKFRDLVPFLASRGCP